MITLMQYSPNDEEMLNSISKLEEFSIKINTSMVDDDIKRLKEEGKAKGNKVNESNIKRIVEHLEKFKDKAEKNDNQLEMCWNVKNGIAKTYPMDMLNDSVYKVNMCEYIEIEKEKMISIDLSELSNIISFDYIYRELGESIESVEEWLKDTGIVGITDSKILSSHFEDNILQLSKILKISDSPYIAGDKKVIKDYFCNKEFSIEKENKVGKQRFTTHSYGEVTDYSCKHAMGIIASKIVSNLDKLGEKFKLVTVSDTIIAFTVDSDKADIDKEVVESIVVRAFGRKFKVEPIVKVY